MICIGIDWADDKHDICIRVAGDRRLLAEFTITNDEAGVRQLDEKVATLGYEPADCPVAIETPHGLLVGYLLQKGYPVYSIPPKAVTRYRDRHKMSGAKSDISDTRILADILVWIGKCTALSPLTAHWLRRFASSVASGKPRSKRRPGSRTN
jgi:transposase